ncbi:MAG TPA: sigma-70 family RNA polymerase sigma factor [Candidatus Binatia bacterium]|jgi:RNA polymerase sigma factor (sigma-70 family)|nr:sigma-70 family RNA polymerase sigma factor [Candidatus Binatia bacterium]
MNELRELIPTRQSLLIRLKDWNDNKSWREFFETYWKLIYRTGIKAGLTDEEAQDVVQETMISVFKAMPGFHYSRSEGSFKGWLLQLTSWRIRDQLRKKDPEMVPEDALRCSSGSEDGEGDTVEGVIDPASLHAETSWDADWEENLMEAAIARVKRKVDPKAYQMFDLAVFKDWPVSRIAQSLNVGPAEVYMARHRISKRIKKEVKLLQTQPIRLSESMEARANK